MLVHEEVLQLFYRFGVVRLFAIRELLEPVPGHAVQMQLEVVCPCLRFSYEASIQVVLQALAPRNEVLRAVAFETYWV